MQATTKRSVLRMFTSEKPESYDYKKNGEEKNHMVAEFYHTVKFVNFGFFYFLGLLCFN